MKIFLMFVKEMKIIYRMQVLRNVVTSFAMSLTLFASMTAFLVLYAIRTHNRDQHRFFITFII